MTININSANDSRRGVTLLIRPGSKITNAIHYFLRELKAVDPGLYYYPKSDIHVTIVSIISCYENFDPATIFVQDYIDTIQSCMNAIRGIKIHFKGVTASDGVIMIQGFSQR